MDSRGKAKREMGMLPLGESKEVTESGSSKQSQDRPVWAKPFGQSVEGRVLISPRKMEMQGLLSEPLLRFR